MVFDRINRIYRIIMANVGELTGKIIGCAMKVHRVLGPGFLESVYQKALAVELAKVGLKIETEKKIKVYYAGVDVGDFAADMVVDDLVIVENKSVQALVKAHEVQLVNYLTATGMDVGLLLNFGTGSLEFKKKFRMAPGGVRKLNRQAEKSANF
ncbi:MAG: GxxExxY protein [Verrucomicrobiae bacterium]|nr:GxxExxY protein [Verrucomicrobiae bacterium]